MRVWKIFLETEKGKVERLCDGEEKKRVSKGFIYPSKVKAYYVKG
jgi:hypothetical protein